MSADPNFKLDPQRARLGLPSDPHSGIVHVEDMAYRKQFLERESENNRHIAEYNKKVEQERKRLADEAAAAARAAKNRVKERQAEADKEAKKKQSDAEFDFIFSEFRKADAAAKEKGQDIVSGSFKIDHDTGIVKESFKAIGLGTLSRPQHQSADTFGLNTRLTGDKYYQKAVQNVKAPVLLPNETEIKLSDGTRIIGDRQAIQQIKQEAFTDLSKKGGTVTTDRINQRTYELLQTKYRDGIPIQNNDLSYLNGIFNNVDAEKRRVESTPAQTDAQKMIDEMLNLGYGGHTVKINADGSKTYSFVPLAGRKQYEYKATDPMNPFKIEKVEVKPTIVKDIAAPSFSEKNDILTGFTAAFDNTVRSFTGIPDVIQGKEQPKFHPEAEGQFFGNVIDTVKDAYNYGPFSPTTSRNSSIRFDNLKNDLISHGEFYAGSIGASVLMWASPAVAVKAAKYGIDAVRFAGITKNFIKPLQAAVKEDNALVKLDKDGIINVGKESDNYRYAVGRVTTVPILEKTFAVGKNAEKGFTLTSGPLSKTAVEFFARQPESIKNFLVESKRAAGYSGTFVDLEKTGSTPVKALKKGATRNGVSVTNAGNVFEMTEVIAGKAPVALKVPKYEKTVVKSETFTGNEFKALLGSDEGLAKFLGKESTGTRVTKADRLNRPSTPFSSTVEQVQKSESKVTKQFLKDMGILDNTSKKGSAGPSIINPLVAGEKGFENSMKILGLDWNANDYSNKTTLGLYGATGVSKSKRNKENTIMDSVFEMVAYPEGKTGPKGKDVSSLMSHTSIISSLETGQNLDKVLGVETGKTSRKGQKSIVDEFSKYAQNLIPKVRNDGKSRTETRADTTSAPKHNFDFGLDLIQKQMTDIVQVPKQTTRQRTTDFDIIRTPPDVPTFRFDLPDFSGFKLFGQKKKKGIKRSNRVFRITDILDFSKEYNPTDE